jgi:hypothetical protein
LWFEEDLGSQGGYREPVGEPAREHPTVGCRGYRRPVLGAENVARFLGAITVEEQTARFLESVGSDPSGEVRIHLAQVNGETGVVITADDEPISALIMDVSDGLVRTICLVANPEKLGGVQGVEPPR